MANDLPYSKCEYVTNKVIWADKLYAQLVHIMQKYFLCNLSTKLQNNFRFYGDDMKQLLQYCNQMNISIDISSLYKKFRTFFRSGQKLNRAFVERVTKIFRTVLRLFLTKVNHSAEWYFIYKHPDGDCPYLDRDFAIRDKQLTNLMKASSLNSSFDWNTNSFLMMRLGYTDTHRFRFQCKDKQFLQYIIAVAFADAKTQLDTEARKKRERVCSRLLFMNYSPVASKDIEKSHSRSILEKEKPYLKEVLEFEENCIHTYNLIKEAISKTNIISIVRSFFNFLCLEIQMMDTDQPIETIAEMLRVDLQHFNHEERVNVTTVALGTKESIYHNFKQIVIEKGYFKQVELKLSQRDKETKEGLYRTFTYTDFDFDMGKIKPLGLSGIPQSSYI